MRWIALIGVVGLLTTGGGELRSRIEHWVGPDEDPQERAAVEITCRDVPATLRDDCVRELEREFERGSRRPEPIVQRHCTRIPSEWPRAAQTPPGICQEIFGGWLES